MIPTIDSLHNNKNIQAHHWAAAKWMAEQTTTSPAFIEIAESCKLIEACENKFARRQNIDPYTLLFKVCVARETIPTNETVIGVLREGLNAVSRAMARAGKNIERQTNTGTTGESGR